MKVIPDRIQFLPTHRSKAGHHPMETVMFSYSTRITGNFMSSTMHIQLMEVLDGRQDPVRCLIFRAMHCDPRAGRLRMQQVFQFCPVSFATTK